MKTVQIEYLPEELIEWARAKFKIPDVDLVDGKKVVEALTQSFFPGADYHGPFHRRESYYCEVGPNCDRVSLKMSKIYVGDKGSFSTWVLRVDGGIDISEKVTAVLAANNLLNPTKRIEAKKEVVHSGYKPPIKRRKWPLYGLATVAIFFGWWLFT